MLGWELPPHHAGGMGIACYQMCKELSTRGIDIEFILPYTADFNIPFMKVRASSSLTAEEVMNLGGVYDTEYFTNTGKDIEFSSHHDYFARQVAKLASAAEFDIIHAHDWLTFQAGLEAKRVSGKPLILHVHATQYDQSAGNSGNPIVREIEQQAMLMADHVYAVSQYTKDVIVREYGLPPEKITVVHNAMEITYEEIDANDNAYVYLNEMKQRGYKVVVNAGRKTIQKGLTHLLDAAELVVKKQPKTLFLLVGGGDQEQELIEYAAQKGISNNVLFVGWLNGTGKHWRDSFKIADVFIMPSVSEPFGLVALEAIGYGAPVIVSHQSGVAEVLRNSYKVDFWDKNKMADQILSLVEYDSLRGEMWRNAFEEYRTISWSHSASVMHDGYLRHSGAHA